MERTLLFWEIGPARPARNASLIFVGRDGSIALGLSAENTTRVLHKHKSDHRNLKWRRTVAVPLDSSRNLADLGVELLFDVLTFARDDLEDGVIELRSVGSERVRKADRAEEARQLATHEPRMST